MSFRLSPAKNVTKVKAFTLVILISIFLSFFGILVTLISLDAENILFVDQHFEGFSELQQSLGTFQQVEIRGSDGLSIQSLRANWTRVDENQWRITLRFVENGSRFTADHLNRLHASRPDLTLSTLLIFSDGELYGFSVENWLFSSVYGDVYVDQNPYPTIEVYYQFYHQVRIQSVPSFDISDDNSPLFYVGSLSTILPDPQNTELGVYYVNGPQEEANSYELVRPLNSKRLVRFDELPQKIGQSVIITAPLAAVLATAVAMLLIFPPIVLMLILNFLDSKLRFMRRPPTWWIRRMKGKMGKFFSLLRLGKFDGDYILEEHMVKDYSVDKTQSLVKQVLKRWRQIFLMPASIAALLITLLLEITTIPPPEEWTVTEILFVPTVIWLLPILFVVFLFPAVWLLEDAGLKRIVFADTGDLEEVSYVGTEISSSFEQFFGIPAILLLANKLFSLSSLSFVPTFGTTSETLAIINELTFGTIEINFQLPFRFLAAFGLLIFLGAIFLPSGAVLIFHLIDQNLIVAIRRTRLELLTKDVATAGAIVPQLRPGIDDAAIYQDLSDLQEEKTVTSRKKTIFWVSFSIASILLAFVLIFALILLLQRIF